MRVRCAFVFLLFILSNRNTQAQTVAYGLLSSYGQYRLNQTESRIGQYIARASDTQVLDMWRVGAFARIPSSNHPDWSLQVEAYRSGRNAFIQLENTTPDPSGYPDWIISSPSLQIRRYELASFVSVKPFGGPIRLLAGPAVGYSPRRELLRRNADWPEGAVSYPYRKIEIDMVRGINRGVVGFQAGVGVDIWRTTLDIRRETNITPITRQVSHNGHVYPTRLTGNTWLLTLGFRIIDPDHSKKPAAH